MERVIGFPFKAVGRCGREIAMLINRELMT